MCWALQRCYKVQRGCRPKRDLACVPRGSVQCGRQQMRVWDKSPKHLQVWNMTPECTFESRHVWSTTQERLKKVRMELEQTERLAVKAHKCANKHTDTHFMILSMCWQSLNQTYHRHNWFYTLGNPRLVAGIHPVHYRVPCTHICTLIHTQGQFSADNPPTCTGEHNKTHNDNATCYSTWHFCTCLCRLFILHSQHPVS